tara:strand:- start:58 stop:306 length:249 start_codon:yes stop_codon:yes gene_type:complete
MDSNEFVIWLRGFVEASGTELSVTQLSTVKNKLETVTEVECGYSNPLIPPTYSPPTISPNTPFDTPNKIWCSTNTGGVDFNQ